HLCPSYRGIRILVLMDADAHGPWGVIAQLDPIVQIGAFPLSPLLCPRRMERDIFRPGEHRLHSAQSHKTFHHLRDLEIDLTLPVALIGDGCPVLSTVSSIQYHDRMSSIYLSLCGHRQLAPSGEKTEDTCRDEQNHHPWLHSHPPFPPSI